MARGQNKRGLVNSFEIRVKAPLLISLGHQNDQNGYPTCSLADTKMDAVTPCEDQE